MMNNFFDISEQDIFNFVFYPDQLSIEKKEYLNRHIDEFKEQIDFCMILKQSDIQSDYDKEKCKYDFTIIELLPITPLNHNCNYLTLAAASAELSKKIETKTFMDANSQYLVRLVCTEDEKKLYIFSKEKCLVDAKLTLFPSEKSYKINPAEASIIIDKTEEVEKISIENIN
jgi:hypothetical protein